MGSNGSKSSTAKASTAPAPDDDRKPDTPAQIDKPSWKYIAKKTLREFSKDQCPDLAAALTYHAVLAVFPALLALVSLLGVVGQAEKTTTAALDVVAKLVPASTVDVIKGPLTQLTHSSSAGLALVGGILVALWSASGYVGAFSRAMNRIYEIDEGRPFWKLRPIMLAVTALAIVLVAVMGLMLVLSGPIAQAVGDSIGLGSAAVLVWNIVKWPVLLILVVIVIAILYYATPNVQQPKFRWMSIGSLISLVIFILASLGFAIYVANFSHYNKTYGTIGGAIVVLLWLWILNMSLLFGAEFDAEMERGRELQAGIPAEESIQLPPRDTRQSDKRQAQEDEEVTRGREIRESAAADGAEKNAGERPSGKAGSQPPRK
ncbi:YihY/virulence factor BrkB family protein [Arthrobacter sp. H14-L1]|uniref:YihY/virulence factor BrkB family protein n=1 Tax=Arthrobacter sp. H14-L1 TaxID=2996697 RepID=UPI002271E972|nr:YihY/virulence factor BrkB family protein [Arthrobacter sp. H14-L1]MCY0903924.1 YihY/virulence factor BrkB family protein [Arthrobacter sp. H14-L1]